MVPHHAVRWREVLIPIVIVALAAGIGQTRLGHAMLERAGLVKAPASYTSLAFVHPAALPAQLTSEQAAVVSFIIDNNSGASGDYRWSVSLIQGQRVHRMAAGHVSVLPRQAAAITRSAQIFCTQGPVRIVVSLVNPAEHIDAWTACKRKTPRANHA
jgi:hypothetical protein